MPIHIYIYIYIYIFTANPLSRRAERNGVKRAVVAVVAHLIQAGELDLLSAPAYVMGT